MRSMLLAVFFLLCLKSSGLAMVYVEQDGLFLYYPEGQQAIAHRLFEEYPSMIRFLKERGMAVKRPLHVILDGDLDRPEVDVHMIPHREIRIPLRAPGVLEDGYMEVNPWTYFLFKGLCLQAMYAIRSGIPGGLHTVFGEVMSPNIIIPDWFTDGTCHLLYTLFRGREIEDPFSTAILRAVEPPDIAKTSHHPHIWPGFYSYRIYGRPFLRWVYRNYGWDPLMDFIKIHGEGIFPVEIDLKAKKTLGKSWSELWDMFKEGLEIEGDDGRGKHIGGYWSKPFVYWSVSGIYPGLEKTRLRGRYGYVDAGDILWLSEYDEEGIARIVKYRRGVALPLSTKHVWDPGPGGIGVTRMGHRPALIRFPRKRGILSRLRKKQRDERKLIPAPPGVIQLSGPVQDSHGRIAVSANRDGNWDIWIYHEAWTRVTRSASVEMDPWWEGDRLVFSSNISGRFQIHDAEMRQVTDCKTAGLLPREGTYLCLGRKGWMVTEVGFTMVPRIKPRLNAEAIGADTVRDSLPESQPYTPLKSIWPNYWLPDIFVSEDDLQLGAITKSRDVSGEYRMDVGIRYSFDTDFISLRLGGTAKDFGVGFTRYAIDYTTALEQRVDEIRNEAKASWTPFGIEELELSINYRTFEPLKTKEPEEDELWGALHVEKLYGDLWLWGNLEIYTEGSQSLFGGFRLLFGEQMYASFHMQAGKSWGDIIHGHQTFRIGGNTVEGYFTQRPTRLFPLRGFHSNILDASQAITGGVEVFWPLFKLEKGYKTLPLFFHGFRLGTFIDAGVANETVSWDNMLVGAGVELVTSMEIAWGYLSRFRVGIAWPLKQPDILDEKGPVFLIQLGRPL